MKRIAPTAVIDPACELPDDIEIGPGCVVERDVRIGPGCRLMSNVVLMGNTTIGRENVFYPNSVIGTPPQDLKHDGADTTLIIGDHNVFRESFTAHTGTVVGGGTTRIGSHNQFQVGVHIAHDCIVGNHVVISNSTQLAGHICIEDHATLSGMVGIHQFVTIGQYAFVAGLCRCTNDVPPYLTLGPNEAYTGVNSRGMGRWGFSDRQIAHLKLVYRRLYPRRGREEQDRGMWRTLYGMIFSRRARRSAMSLVHRIADVEETMELDDNSRYLIEFIKRSVHDGVYGRQREARRKDAGMAPPKFFAAAASLRETPA